MRYYEITHRPRTQTATDRIAWNEPRHLQHDARGIWQRAQACVCLVKLTEPSHISDEDSYHCLGDADDRSRLGQPYKPTMRSV